MPNTRTPRSKPSTDSIAHYATSLLAHRLLQQAAMDSIATDIRRAVRTLASQPRFSATAVATFAAGIAAASVVFSLVNAVYLRQFPGREPDRLVAMARVAADGGLNASFSHPHFRILRDRVRSARLAAYASTSLVVSSGAVEQLAPAELVSWDYFDTLGVRPALGRWFVASEDAAPGAAPVAVLGYELWQSARGGRSDAVGDVIRINGEPYTIVGVAPPEMRSARLGRAAEIWVPLAMQARVRPPTAGTRQIIGSRDLLEQPTVSWLDLVGRLADDATLESLRGELESAFGSIAESGAFGRGEQLTAVLLGDEAGVRRLAATPSFVLALVVTLVLAVACANVATLMLARRAEQQRQAAIQLALGASQWRVAREVLLESLVLCAAGGALGLLASLWAADLVYLLDLPPAVSVAADGRVAAFALLASMVSALACGVVPAAFAGRTAPATALADGTRTAGRRAAVGRALVTVQLAVSVALVAAALAFAQSARNLALADPGFSTEGVVQFTVDLDLRGYSDAAGRAFHDQLLQGLRALPGVRQASASSAAPLSGSPSRLALAPADRPVDPDARPSEVLQNLVDFEYFETLDIPVTAGRAFDAGDRTGSPPVVMVSETLARQFWPDRDAVGREVRFGDGTLATVVGVAADSAYRTLRQRREATVFLPLSQRYRENVTVFVRAVLPSAQTISQARALMARLDPALPLYGVTTLAEQTWRSTRDARSMATVMTVFGGIALGLAAVGLYGLTAYLVGQRAREYGIRMALGADRGRLAWRVMAEGQRLALVGIVLGAALAAAGGRVAGSLLFGVAGTLPAALVAALMMVAVTAAACSGPVLRATRLDPAATLHAE